MKSQTASCDRTGLLRVGPYTTRLSAAIFGYPVPCRHPDHPGRWPLQGRSKPRHASRSTFPHRTRTSKTAYDRATQSVQKILALAQKNGVAESDLSSGVLTISPFFEEEESAIVTRAGPTTLESTRLHKTRIAPGKLGGRWDRGYSLADVCTFR